MSNTVLVHRIGAEPIELKRSQCYFFDRSRMLTGQSCPTKRYFQYHWQGTGVESAYPSEDLELGSAVHAGLEVILREQYLLDEPDYTGSQADIIVGAAEEAKMKMLESGKRGLSIQDNDLFGETAPEIAQLLIEEQANLAYALVWTFGQRRLASLLERYEVVAVEPEICWLVGWAGEPYQQLASLIGDEEIASKTKGKAIVMMSRPDAILRSRADGKLWTVSWKTSKRFDQEYIERLECDVQGITEGLAVQAMYGEEPGGTFYTYFIKGDKYFDADIGMKRYTSSLIRPYSNWTGIGEPQFRAAYEWINEAGDKKRIGKGWERTDIWKQMEMNEWLTLLGSGEVQPEANRDWLKETVAEPLPQAFNASEAQRWIAVAVQEEARWLDGSLLKAKHTGSCFTWGRRCQFFDICFRGESVEMQLASGRKKLRTPNHNVEVSEDAN